MKYQAPRGTNDIIPGSANGSSIFEIHRWQHLESCFFKVATRYGYQEIRTPLFEDIDLFVRSSGVSSEVVTKEMYDFKDKGDRHIALRPEFTAPVIRAYLENTLNHIPGAKRLCYTGAVFRYGRQQKGRYRQFHQAGLELIGVAAPTADAEIIEASVAVFASLGLKDLTVKINCIGRAETRKVYGDVILQHLSAWLSEQSEDGKAKARQNPLRLLDSKDSELREKLDGLPPIIDFLTHESLTHFNGVQAELTEAGVTFQVQPDIVRGLDYYTDTVFEVTSAQLGDLALCGGGRYDELVQQLGGPPTPSVGVGMGIERLLMTLSEQNLVPQLPPMDAFVIAGTKEMEGETSRLTHELRSDGFSVQRDIEAKNLKGQFKQADRSAARWAIVVDAGESTPLFQMKNLQTAEQTVVPKEEIRAWLQKDSS